MNFNEITKPTKPTFNLSLSLTEAIDLWHIVNFAVDNGNEKAKIFVEALYNFADNSNSYNEYLNTRL
jgi:hypothetical protein